MNLLQFLKIKGLQTKIPSNYAKYPLSDALSYDKVSMAYKKYVCALSTQLEPTSYKEAAKFLNGFKP